jgi:hypothetical protein
VAGFDFEFTYTEVQAPIVRVCQAAARTRARRLGISWNWRTLALRHVVVVVDGNSRRTDLLGYRLERDLPLVAEGCGSVALGPTQRARLGRGFADMMLRGRHVWQEGPMLLRGVADTFYCYPPYDYNCPGALRLQARLSITEDLIVGWNFAEIAPEVLLEELHTACELVLEELVNKRAKRLSFAELIARAKDSGLLDPSPLASLWPETPSVTLLTELKDLRKEVRHRAAGGSWPWLDEHWEEVAILLERLVSRVTGPVRLQLTDHNPWQRSERRPS